MDLFDKLKILTDAAKYDVACTSSGVDRSAERGGAGKLSDQRKTIFSENLIAIVVSAVGA